MSLIKSDVAMDNQTALRLKKKLAEEFRDQYASLATRVTNECYLLEVGRVVLEGDTKQIMTDQTLVRKAFLGG